MKETARLPQQVIWQVETRNGILLFEQLTPREVEVLQLVGEGLSDQDIADQIYVSERTVRVHMVNMLRKLNARNRTHMVRMAIEAGVIVVGTLAEPTDAKTLLALANHYMRLAQKALEAQR